MGFLSGRVTYTRYRVSGDEPPAVRRGAPGAGRAARRSAGTARATRPTASRSAGPAATTSSTSSFDLAKNVVNDALHLAMRVDTDKIPGSLLKAYTRIETDARAKVEPERLPHQGPAHRGQGGRPHPRRGRGRRRPVPPHGPLPGPLGRPDERPLRRAPPAPRSSTGC